MDRRDRSERCADILNLYAAAYQAAFPKAKYLFCANLQCAKPAKPVNGLYSFFCSEKCRTQFWKEHRFEGPGGQGLPGGGAGP